MKRIMNTRVQLLVLLIILLTNCLFSQTVTVSTFIGSTEGYVDEALFDGPEQMAFDDQGNLFLADRWNNVIRKISPEGTVTTIVDDFVCSGLAVDAEGDLFASQGFSNKIWEFNLNGDSEVYAGASRGSIRGDQDGSL
jgi:hypothetical protein